MPKDFRKDLGRISQKELLEKYGCNSASKRAFRPEILVSEVSAW